MPTDIDAADAETCSRKILTKLQLGARRDKVVDARSQLSLVDENARGRRDQVHLVISRRLVWDSLCVGSPCSERY